MTRDDQYARAAETSVEDARIYTAEEVVREEGRDLEVPEDREFRLAPGEPHAAHFFFRVRLRTYSDVQLLGFVPRALPEEKVRRAIAEDDGGARQLAQETLRAARPLVEADCQCAPAASGPLPYGRQLRTTYTRIRRFHHPAFAELLSDHYGVEVAWDSPTVVNLWRWASSPEAIAVIALFGDITINRNATLLVDSTTKALWAANIWIHRTGRLVSQSGYLKIWAHSIRNLGNPVITDVVHTGPWLLHG
jgi:hypothetical protein